jgi:hypothetical protein
MLPLRDIFPKRSFSFPAAQFCGKLKSWANDEKRANALFNFYFSTT